MSELGKYSAIEFHQYGDSDDDRLIMFAAPASVLAQWAGVPRKGWRLRSLYQRWITPGRENDVRRFWDDARAYSHDGRRFLLGPTALTIAASEPLVLHDGVLTLSYERPFPVASSDAERLAIVAANALAKMRSRFTVEELEVLDSDELAIGPTRYESNHVLESAIQILQMSKDSEAFISYHDIGEAETRELIEALEAVSRPALVVDGQHRLLGAAKSGELIVLPVVVLPSATWTDQVYQFVLINEAAKKVDTSLLTDIFGNSLTPTEQTEVRRRLATSRIDVEGRIAAVVADRHDDSPFQGMVKVNLGGTQPADAKGYLTEATIRQLIDGGRGNDGFRTSNEFYRYVVEPRFPDREDWESWTDGQWRGYWFAFWRAVRDYYNAEALSEGAGVVLWSDDSQTNLTKGVSLRLFQQLFLRKAVDRAKATEAIATVLEGRLGSDEAAIIVAEERKKTALPESPEIFEADVREWFLAKGVPARVFLRSWVKSLDQAAGMEDLAAELEKAWDTVNRGDRYVARNKAVFAVGDDA